MHGALQIPEILLNIFGHCRLPTTETPGSDLPAVARTCRTFKEPALDVLWGELIDPSPLAQCLPEASRQISAAGYKRYSFSRPLTQSEYGILRSYTHRVLSISDGERGLDWESVKAFLNPPTSEPLFPNLLYLWVGRSVGIKDLLRMPFPSLISFEVAFSDMENLRVLQDSLYRLSKFSPNVKRLYIALYRRDAAFSNFFSRYVCRWKSLQTVDCSDITLDVDAFAHLSRMPALSHLTFTLSSTLPDQINPSNSPLCFSSLQGLVLYSDVLGTVLRLLSSIRLPALTGFAVYSGSHLSKQDVSAFLASIQTSGASHTLQRLWLMQTLDLYRKEDPRPILGFEDLQPCMAFSNLRRIKFNIAWDVHLTNSRLLTLASAWPDLEHFIINDTWGWKRAGGITPNGLLQLLRICPSLSSIAIALDTYGHTELPLPPKGLGWTLPRNFRVDVVDSFIAEESVPAMATFFGGFVPPPSISCRVLGWPINEEDLRVSRWRTVYDLASGAVSQRS